MHLHVDLRQAVRGVSAVKSQMEYRAKAKEYARLTILTKSLRESRRYRKLAEMYWALALGEKPESVQPSKMTPVGEAPEDGLQARCKPPSACGPQLRSRPRWLRPPTVHARYVGSPGRVEIAGASVVFRLR